MTEILLVVKKLNLTTHCPFTYHLSTNNTMETSFKPILIEYEPDSITVFTTLNDITAKYRVFFEEKDNQHASIILDIYNKKFIPTAEHLTDITVTRVYANYFYAIGDKENNIKYLTISANLGDAHSMANLSHIYHEQKQFELSEKYINMAYELDATYANYIKGCMLLSENDVRANEYFEKVITEPTEDKKTMRGFSACYIAQFHYENDNEEKALEYFEKSAHLGNHNAIDCLVEIYEEKCNDNMVMKFLKIGEEHNNPLSILKLCTLCTVADVDKMLYYAEKGVALGNKECMYFLGTFYFYTVPNVELMKKYLHKAVLEHFCCNSASILGTYYFSVEKNESMAKNCFLLAIVKNNSKEIMEVMKLLFKDKLVDLYETLLRVPTKVEVIENEIAVLKQNEVIVHYNNSIEFATECVCVKCNANKKSITFLNCNHHVCLDCFKYCLKCGCE